MQSDLDQYREIPSPDAFSLQNSKLLKVSLEQVSIEAKLGSMVAHQGDVSFSHSGGGIGRRIKKAVTGEGQPLMKVSGQGTVYLADAAQDIHLVYLQDDAITVNGPNVLAFDDGIDWDIDLVKRVSGMIGGGLFNTKLRGTGWVALVTDGPPVRLDVGQVPTFADAQAAVAWSAGVKSSIKTDINLKTVLGMSSGETLQLGFEGDGWVLVQPSEERLAPPAGADPTDAA